MPEPVIKTIDVPCSQEQAFRIYTENLNSWWPRDRHSVSALSGEAAKAVHLDLRVGGQMTETAYDDSTHLWGSVVAYDPFSKLAITWHVTRPADEATLIELEFEPMGDQTRVTLRHSGWEVLGADADEIRNGYNTGWDLVLETCFGGACAAAV